MPIFEYQCRDCSGKFEKIVFGQEVEVSCPNCGGMKTERLISAFAVGAAGQARSASPEPGPCHCGAPRRGMCQGG